MSKRTSITTIAVLLASAAFAAPANAAPEAPAVEAESASAVTPLEAMVNPNNELITECTFEYGTTTSYGSSVPCNPGAVGGSAEESVSHLLTGLQGATTYHFRVLASNATGTTPGPDAEFTTREPEPPNLVALFGALGGSNVTIEVFGEPDYFEHSTVRVEYGTDPALAGATATPEQALALIKHGFGLELYAGIELGKLTVGTHYYMRTVATDPAGTRVGPIRQFLTRASPLVASAAVPSNPTRDTVELSGASVNVAGVGTTYAVRYLSQPAYEHAVSEGRDPYENALTVSPVGFLPAEAALKESQTLPLSWTPTAIPPFTAEELTPGTSYRYVLVATNELGSARSTEGTFTTLPPTPPTTTTGAATGISQQGATLTGSADTAGLPANAKFEFGPTPALGSTLAAATETEGTALTATATLEDLAAASTYYYRFTLTTADGTSTGEMRAFTTPPFPAAPATTLPRALTPFLTLAQVEAKEPPQHPTTTPPTNVQKLAKAPKACHKKHGAKRKACEKQARKRYAPAKKH
jgi:hypothetical protein